MTQRNGRPGRPGGSALWLLLSAPGGSAAMPPLGRHVLDAEGVELIRGQDQRAARLRGVIAPAHPRISPG